MAKFYIVFRSIAGSYSGSHGNIPSPGRVIGALINASSWSKEVSDEVRKLVLLPQPDIGASHNKNPIKNTSYVVSNHFYGDMSKPPKGHSKSILVNFKDNPMIKVGKTFLNRSLRNEEFTFCYLVDDENDTVSRDLIEQACDRVTHFGTGKDFFYAYCSDNEPEGINIRLRFYGRASSSSRGANKMRLWSPELLEYYDRRFEISQDTTSNLSYVSDQSIPEGVWYPYKKEHSTGMVILETKYAYKQKVSEDILGSISYSGDSDNFTPTVTTDMRGYIRGVMFPDVDGVNITNAGFFADDDKGMKINDPSYWCAPSTEWISATPLIGHHDPQVVKWILEKQGFLVTRIEEEPFDSSQGVKINSIKPEHPYKAWWLHIQSPYKREDFINLGEFRESGAGVFRPIKKCKGEEF